MWDSANWYHFIRSTCFHCGRFWKSYMATLLGMGEAYLGGAPKRLFAYLVNNIISHYDNISPCLELPRAHAYLIDGNQNNLIPFQNYYFLKYILGTLVGMQKLTKSAKISWRADFLIIFYHYKDKRQAHENYKLSKIRLLFCVTNLFIRIFCMAITGTGISSLRIYFHYIVATFKDWNFNFIRNVFRTFKCKES